MIVFRYVVMCASLVFMIGVASCALSEPQQTDNTECTGAQCKLRSELPTPWIASRSDVSAMATKSLAVAYANPQDFADKAQLQDVMSLFAIGGGVHANARCDESPSGNVLCCDGDNATCRCCCIVNSAGGGICGCECKGLPGGGGSGGTDEDP